LNFPFEKLDIVFIPAFARTESSQNVGCIFIDEFYIINDLNQLETCNLNNIIAKNICHMWFGNAVSCVWWDDLWLNDAFSLYLSQYCLKKISEKVNIVNIKLLI